ncbi:HET-domain-containing protein [Ophiobolus disseminans]|uniref:HET-domain-containing protein n=1 Tax=Ophiobolus disseminans TaxID=1469910 RepID=A0A6A7A7A5_9PLEO|nr:HET-domain-containing protein [Ophiobolus disseminans]
MEVPQTIEDAIDLTKMLGFKYLWVDSLCIIQDDTEDQQIQINNMHGVYKTAFVTIVAASGVHSNAGLPGLRPGTRRYEQRETVVIDPTGQDPGMSLVTNVKNNPKSWGSSYAVGHGDIEMSVWNQRAWTMQEKALSRRTITFSDEQVSWDCPCASFSEEAFFEIRNLRYRSIISTTYQDLTLSSLAWKTSPWDLYRNLVDRYSQRNLSYPGDYNDAFVAVLEMISDTTGERFLWGLPCSRFDLALSWDTIYGGYRRVGRGWGGLATRTAQLEMTVLRDHNQNLSVHFSDLQKYLPNLTIEALSLSPDEYLLFFWTRTARFLVRPPDSTTFADHQSVGDNVHEGRPAIHNAEGRRVGTACRMKGEHWAGDFRERWYDFVAVGRRAVYEIPDYPATVLALQIEWVGDVARRDNIAEIGEEDWLAAEPRRVLVALE